jgi:hypothetical protein
MAIMWLSHLFFQQTEPISACASVGRLMMSAIAPPKFRISAHADYYHGESRALNQLEWERPTQRLHSWCDVLIPALTAATTMAVALAAFN